MTLLRVVLVWNSTALIIKLWWERQWTQLQQCKYLQNIFSLSSINSNKFTFSDIDETTESIEIPEADESLSSTKARLQYKEPLEYVNFADEATQSNIGISFEEQLDTEKKCISFTGVGNDVIDACVISVNEVIKANDGQCIPNLRKKIVLVFTKLKLNISFACLAVMFNFSPSSCTKYFYTVLHLLALALKPVVFWPTKDAIMANMTKCFEKYKNTRVVLDCTEVKVQKCKCLKCRIRTYSHYKGTHTFKFLIGITPAGTISFVSSAYGGRATDKAIFLKENILDKCDPYDAIMVDKGFMIENECAEKYVKLIRPPFLKKQQQFSKEEAEQTADIARARVHVERAIQRIKLFSILNDQIEWYIIPHINDIINVVCALVNLSPPILAGSKFENCIDGVVNHNINLVESNI